VCRPSGTLIPFSGYRGLSVPGYRLYRRFPPQSAQSPRCSGTPVSRLQDCVEQVVNGLVAGQDQAHGLNLVFSPGPMNHPTKHP
jgi:hypothetical protein